MKSAVSTDQGRSWFVDNGTCTADVEDLTNNAAPPARITDLGVPGNWMLRAHGRPDLPLLGWVFFLGASDPEDEYQTDGKKC